MKVIVALTFLIIGLSAYGQDLREEARDLDSLLNYANSIARQDHQAAIDTARYVQERSVSLNLDSLEAHSLRVIGRVFSFLNESDSAKSYFIKSKRIYDELEADLSSAIMDMELGIVSRHTGNYELAMQHYLKAEAVFQKYGSDGRLGEIYRSIAIIKSRENKLAEALEYYFKSEDYANRVESYSELAAIQNGISRIFNKQKRFDKALEYLKKALATYQRIGHGIGEAITYANLGDFYLGLEKFDSVIYYSNLSIAKRPPTSYRGIAISEYNKGLAYREMKQTESAVASFRKSENLFNLANDAKSVIYPRTGMIELYRMEGNLNKALKEAEETLEAALEIQPKDALKDLYRTLSDIHFSMGNYREALLNRDQYNALKDSILNQQNSQQLIEMETRYETEKKEQEIVSLKQEAEIANLQIAQQRFLIVASLSVLGIIVIAGYTFYHNRKLKLNQQRLLVEQRLLRSQMNPHFLFNALSSVHGYIYEGDKKKAAQYLSMFSELSRDILNQSSEELIALEKELSTLEKYVELQKTRFPEISYHVDVGELETDIVMVPPMILQPFIENAIEHGFRGREKGNLTLKVSEEKEDLCIHIIDDGNGLVNKTSAHKSKAIEITRERLSLLLKKGQNFTLDVVNRNDCSGVEVTISFPLIAIV